jgi:DNA-directed RNA polymerase alpha subunit
MKEKNGTENLVFTSIDIDTLVDRIADRVIHIMLFNGNTKMRKDFFERNDLLKTPIGELNLSVRTYNCFYLARIKTLEDLTMYTEKELMKLRNFGKIGLIEIKNLLEQYNLSLKVEQ